MVWEKGHWLTTLLRKENKNLMEPSETKIEVRDFGYPHHTEAGGVSQDETAMKFQIFHKQSLSRI